MERSHSSQLAKKGPSPLLTPMERFLSTPCERKPYNSTTKLPGPKVVDVINQGAGYNVPHNIGAVGILPRGVLLDESAGLYDGLLVEGDASYCNVNGGYVLGKVAKSGSCNSSASDTVAAPVTNVVKGQWTAEEDSMLVKLVKQHGVRKWSQIAKKLAGRIGKQCRERWHNHLRPDIKKDTWSEEEEKLLVEAHEKVGNRWAEIAKRIPGRSENSIKNHWNATKRRHNSKRKSKRKSGQDRSHPSILQEYIRNKTLAENSNSNSNSNSNPLTLSKPPVQGSSFSNFSSTTSFTVEDWLYRDDENIQGPCMLDVSLDFLGFGSDDGQYLMGLEECMASSQAHAGSLYGEATHDHNPTNEGHLHSEKCLSYLLEGGPSPSFDAIGTDNWGSNGDRRESSGFKKDMDLIEMISSSQSSSSQRSSGTSFDCLNF